MERPQPRSPNAEASHEGTPHVQHPKCPYCQAAVRGGELQPFGCPSCMAWSHLPCWEEHGGCPACGERKGAAPGASRRRSASPQVQATPRGASEGAREPWWVGRTSHCTGCGDTFVVRNRYQRFKCPRCSGATPRAILLFLGLALIYLLLAWVFPLAAR